MEWKCLWDWIGDNSDELTALGTLLTALGAVIFGLMQWKINVKLFEAQIPMPVILRDGLVGYESLAVFNAAEDLGTTPIVFKNEHAIATRITGFVVVNKMKYKLAWGNSAGAEGATQKYSPAWDWLGVGSGIGALAIKSTEVPADEPNSVQVTYHDIAGREYRSTMGEDYFTTIEKIKG